MRCVLVASFIALSSFNLLAQDDAGLGSDSTLLNYQSSEKENNFELNGYVKDLVTVSIPTLNGTWFFDNQIHNRINADYQVSSWLNINIEARNRIYFGNSVQQIPDFAEQVNETLDYIRLGGVVLEENSYLIHSVIDRANLRITEGKWQSVIGKQRINWGKSYVWNPNDLFNAYSFFDFDYEERRGTDAVLVKYNLGSLSSVELASNVDSTFGATIIATNYRVNLKEYDFQFLVGKYKTDIAIGTGWAGQIGGTGFKGELTYFQPYEENNTSSTFVGDVSFDYYFPNTLNLRLEIIGNTNPMENSGIQFLTEPVSAKGLINNYISSFVSVGYDITPLVQANLSSIWNIDDGSVFFNPTVNISLNENTDLLIASQIFTGKNNSLYNGLGSFVFTRLKWSF